MASVGDAVGPWTLQSRLGEGGNAVVWRAVDDRDRSVALKVINAKHAEREPYRRFVQEIEFLRSVGSFEGVMPVVEAHLPTSAQARPGERPWLAMPIATPIKDALAKQPLDVVVGALGQIADALARLEAAHGVAHRDLKPNNLYQLEGEWVLGDFGLVALPDGDELTRSDRPLGPAHYVPYEMLANPASADPHLADVYSLGKTLWTLACEQNYPPQGHQPHGTRGFSISDLRPHRNASALDLLVDQMTRIAPADRPSKAEVAEELSRWASLPDGPIQVDLSAARARLRHSMAADISARDQVERNKDLAHAMIRRFNELSAPVNSALRDLHPHAEIDLMGDQYSQNILKSRRSWGSADIELFWHRMSRVSFGPDFNRCSLRMGRGVELTDGGELIFRAFIDVGDEKTSRVDFHWESDDWTAPVGSVQADAVLVAGVEELARQLEMAVGAFVDRLEQRTHSDG